MTENNRIYKYINIQFENKGTARKGEKIITDCS